MATDKVFDTKTALAAIQSFEDAARLLRDIPELQSVAQRMLAPFLESNGSNGHAGEGQMRKAAPQRKKIHWTQRPENRDKVMKMAKARAKLRQA